jgi:small subunit ribosomal protein S17
MKTVKKYKVHDENQEAKIGDLVEFFEGRPASKTKYMYLKQVVKPAAVQE